jgi:hypothetical protein
VNKNVLYQSKKFQIGPKYTVDEWECFLCVRKKEYYRHTNPKQVTQNLFYFSILLSHPCYLCRVAAVKSLPVHIINDVIF